MKKALIFGGAGQIGAETALLLAKNGWAVTATTRAKRPLPGALSALGVQHADASGLSREQMAKSAKGPFDAIIDTTAYDHKDADDLLGLQPLAGAIVAISSSSVYRDAERRSLDEAYQNGFPELPSSIPETTPTVPHGSETYSTKKIAMEQRLQEADVPVTILRPCAIYGRHARALREAWLLKRVADKRTHIPVAYEAKSYFHTSSTTGIASLIACALEKPANQILNVADPSPQDVRGIAAAVSNAIGQDIPLLPFAGDPQGPVGRSPWSVPRPYLLDTGRAQALGWDGGKTYAEEIADVCHWATEVASETSWESAFPLSELYGANVFNYEAEDAFLAKL